MYSTHGTKWKLVYVVHVHFHSDSKVLEGQEQDEHNMRGNFQQVGLIDNKSTCR